MSAERRKPPGRCENRHPVAEGSHPAAAMGMKPKRASFRCHAEELGTGRSGSGLPFSRDQVVQDVAVDIGETSVDAVVANGQACVIDSRQVQNCGVHIVDLDG